MASSVEVANKENSSALPELPSEVERSKALSKRLSNVSVQLPTLSTVAVKGEDKLVEQFMKETVNVKGDAGQVKQSQLYIASFWGFSDVVQSLLDEGAAPNHQNPGSLWTPLHAAAFQEHGKVVMTLLANNAKPDIKDSEGRTPADFASSSVKIWPHFAALGYQRTHKEDLIKKGIIRKVEGPAHGEALAGSRPGSNRLRMTSTVARPESAYVIDDSLTRSRGGRGGQLDSTAMAACLSGDVLASSRKEEDIGIRRRGQ